ncbi:coagulation factor IX-like isoform X2 [Frankliniella occidentalis]|uniref:Coagulation factor IX-like isoform X2 n=2 Tax=Frankliniella occidentalis TaxID=133901 RepID=A0A6J1S3V0_FRAOC|nr:coagulation factor IX-like isoform X2 [Frankliniella occidentalis]
MWTLEFLAGTILAAYLTAAVELPKECGISSAKGSAFVINGKNATVSEFPWHVGLYLESQNMAQFCGGSLIHPRLVMTAAHCVFVDNKLVDAKDMKVSVGSALRDWEAKVEESQKRSVSKIYPHPHFRGRRRNYADDIALLELASPVTVNAYILPICLDWQGNKLASLKKGDVGKVVGWGQTAEKKPSPFLQSAELPYIPFNECVDAVPADFLPFLNYDKFCAGHIDGASVAPGDSGGGLAFEHNGLWYLQGIVSVGVTQKLSYSAFTRVDAYTEWINQILEAISSAGIRWELMSRSPNLPRDALKGGFQRINNNDYPHYVGRIFHKNAIIPATVTRYGGNWIAYAVVDGKSMNDETFEIAIAEEKNVRWLPGAKGKVPVGAAAAGVSANGETVYACRAFDQERKKGNHILMMTPGAMQPSTGVCSIEFHGVNNYTTYQILASVT